MYEYAVNQFCQARNADNPGSQPTVAWCPLRSCFIPARRSPTPVTPATCWPAASAGCAARTGSGLGRSRHAVSGDLISSTFLEWLVYRGEHGRGSGQHPVWCVVELRPWAGRGWRPQHLQLHDQAGGPAMVAGANLNRYGQTDVSVWSSEEGMA